MDILLHERLYATEFTNLNDPMEGVFEYSSNMNSYIIGNLKSKKFKTKICSLSKTLYNGLMWSFYADEHRGCCIEVEPVVGKTWTRLDIDYSSNIYNLTANSSIKDILSHKSKHWEHEKEVRFIKTLEPNKKSISSYLKIKIKTIYLGIRIDSYDARMIKKMVETINKDKKESDQIRVEQMMKGDIDFGYID